VESESDRSETGTIQSPGQCWRQCTIVGQVCKADNGVFCGANERRSGGSDAGRQVSWATTRNPDSGSPRVVKGESGGGGGSSNGSSTGSLPMGNSDRRITRRTHDEGAARGSAGEKERREECGSGREAIQVLIAPEGKQGPGGAPRSAARCIFQDHYGADDDASPPGRRALTTDAPRAPFSLHRARWTGGQSVHPSAHSVLHTHTHRTLHTLYTAHARTCPWVQGSPTRSS